MFFFNFVYVNVCRCAYIRMHAVASRQPRALYGESSRDSLPLGNCTRLAGQNAPGIHLSVAPTLRLQAHVPPHLTFQHRFQEPNSWPRQLSHLSPATYVLLLNVLFLHFQCTQTGAIWTSHIAQLGISLALGFGKPNEGCGWVGVTFRENRSIVCTLLPATG